NGWEIGRVHNFQIATDPALWGVVLSTGFMFRAFGKTFMGTIAEQSEKMPDLNFELPVSMAVLLAAPLWYRFFPQIFVWSVALTFGTSRVATSDTKTYSQGVMSPRFGEQHHQGVSTERGRYNIQQIARK